MLYLIAVVTAAAVSLAVIPLAVALAPRLGMVDVPQSRKVHARPVPRVGGWGIAAGALVAMLLWLPREPLYLAYLFGAAVLIVFGSWDDRKEIGHWPKFGGQLLAVIPLVTWGGLRVEQVPFFDAPLPPEIGVPFTVFALMGMINAVNHSDGLDGLAGGEALLSLAALGGLGYLAGGAEVALIALAAAGAIAGFLRHNNHPASLFMGDSGSQFLGFTLGVLAVLLTQQVDTSLSPAVVLLLLGLPIADILVVLVKRIGGGMNWFLATRNHVHHRLLDLGFAHRDAVVAIYLVHILCVLTGVLLRHAPDALLIGVYLAICTALFIGLHLAEARGWRLPARAAAERPGTSAVWSRRLLAAAVPLYLASHLFAVSLPGPELALVGLAVAALLLAEDLFARQTRSIRCRALLFAAVTFIVFRADAALPWPPLGDLLLITIALTVAAAVLFTPKRRRYEFRPTGTDFLALVAVAVGLSTMLAFPALAAPLRPWIELAVLYYAIELSVIEHRGRFSPPILVTSAAVAVIALRALI